MQTTVQLDKSELIAATETWWDQLQHRERGLQALQKDGQGRERVLPSTLGKGLFVKRSL